MQWPENLDEDQTALGVHAKSSRGEMFLMRNGRLFPLVPTVENRGYSKCTVVEKTTFIIVHHDSEVSCHLCPVQTETYFSFVVIVALIC